MIRSAMDFRGILRTNIIWFPHFEKMLYDNALLIMAYSAAYKVSGNRTFLDTAEQTAEYIFREMTGESGRFIPRRMLTVKERKGKYYIWSYEEVCKILGKEKGEEFCEHFGITRQGNFAGRNIPNLLNGNDISDPLTRRDALCMSIAGPAQSCIWTIKFSPHGMR